MAKKKIPAVAGGFSSAISNYRRHQQKVAESVERKAAGQKVTIEFAPLYPHKVKARSKRGWTAPKPKA